MTGYQLADLPMMLRWHNEPAQWRISPDATLSLQARPGTDLFVDPQGDNRVLNAARLIGSTSGDFLLRARVTVDFKATFDAGVLLVYCHEQSWAKLCFEYSPRGEPTIVSVVTHGVSDDCNSFAIAGNQVWLRLAHLAGAFAFHASTDGQYWQLIRHFALDGSDNPEVGFLAQSPTGNGCSVTFEAIGYTSERLADIRNGE